MVATMIVKMAVITAIKIDDVIGGLRQDAVSHLLLPFP